VSSRVFSGFVTIWRIDTKSLA